MNIVITRMNRSECAKQLEAALARIEESGGKLLDDLDLHLFRESRQIKDKMLKYLGRMQEVGKDYIYVMDSNILPYEIGDAAYEFKESIPSLGDRIRTRRQARERFIEAKKAYEENPKDEQLAAAFKIAEEEHWLAMYNENETYLA